MFVLDVLPSTVFSAAVTSLNVLPSGMSSKVSVAVSKCVVTSEASNLSVLRLLKFVFIVVLETEPESDAHNVVIVDILVFG